MLYLFLDKNQIKLLYIKKTLLGQYEHAFYEKKHQIDLLEKGQVVNTDLLASAMKEAVTFLSSPPVKDKEVFLVLPQKSFQFMRTEVPSDVTPAAVHSFIKDKAKSELTIDLETHLYDYLIQENGQEKVVLFFAMPREQFKKFSDACGLINLQVTSVIPDSLAYYKLFDKTLRKDKKEYIMYASYDTASLSTYIYDSYGPLLPARLIDETLKESTSIEKLMKTAASEYETKHHKINRLILSGENSESVRQDTFTKHVGVWTNPLKRIIPEFYGEYLKLLVSPSSKPIPYLLYDVCLGAFIFSLENKGFSMLKRRTSVPVARPSMRRPSVKLPGREIGIFIASFVLSFIVLTLVSKANFKMPSLPSGKPQAMISPTAAASPTPTETPVPTPAVDRKEIKVKILNGSGTRGKASEVKDDLKNLGYVDILTGNADSFDYTKTEISTKKSAKELGAFVKNDLKQYTSDPTLTSLPEADTADVVLIIGTDFK